MHAGRRQGEGSSIFRKLGGGDELAPNLGQGCQPKKRKRSVAGEGGSIQGSDSGTEGSDGELARGVFAIGGANSDSDSEGDLAELSRALDLDRSGRLRNVRGMQYGGGSLRNFLSAEAAVQLKSDCLKLDRRCGRSGGALTFWMPAGATPRFGLERAAKAIFDYHTAGAEFPSAHSGAEWWVQVRTAGQHPTEVSSKHSSDDAAADGEGEGEGEGEGGEPSEPPSTSIGFHWDMDLDLMASHGAPPRSDHTASQSNT